MDNPDHPLIPQMHLQIVQLITEIIKGNNKIRMECRMREVVEDHNKMITIHL